jgi:ATP-dependent exoDNAse (exonuclease V) alpha subunit
MDGTTIEFDPIAKEALRLMEDTTEHIFLTGRAGTGKSTLLEYFRETTKKKIAVVAPTGVAALNVHGQTIHSFFGFGIDITESTIKRVSGRKKMLFQKLETLVIDEISMVRADLLDCIDKSLRLNGPKPKSPFGGVQIIFIGDLYQLPPIVPGDEEELFSGHYESPYFFAAKAFHAIESRMRYIELIRAYRQKDEDFLEVLDAIRMSRATDAHIALVNTRCDPAFNDERGDFYINLKTTNAAADAWNRAKLAKLSAKPCIFKGVATGEFRERNLPTSETLVIKEGAQVMLLNNDQQDRWVNGDVGKIEAIRQSNDGTIISVRLLTGAVVPVAEHTWDMIKFFYDKETQRIESQTVGTFTQYPIRLAWAVTIHKAQGKTFDRVVIDFGRGTFAHGQAYVALSRCTTLNGLVLKTPLEQKHIFIDEQIETFMERFSTPLGGKIDV